VDRLHGRDQRDRLTSISTPRSRPSPRRAGTCRRSTRRRARPAWLPT
jgi:hypothetical protein